MSKIFILIVLTFITLIMTACSTAPNINISIDPNDLKFSGEKAYELEKEYVTSYTHRDSGTDQSRKGTEWLRQQFEGFGWTCEFDEWVVINYSRPVPLRNLICKLTGVNEIDAREILVMAHHDQAPTTVQGADNDGSGIAILLQLAEIFGKEDPPKYTLVFLADDAEEYGMIGSRRYVQTHPNIKNIIAGLSLDNLGRPYYKGIFLDSVGQFSGYGPLWIALLISDAAKEVVGLWDVHPKAPLDQVLNQAVPISFTDQGPMIAADIPALGFSPVVPPEFSDLNYYLWHHPDDTMEYQSPETLQQSGLTTEVWIRQLLSMEVFPEESGPYLFFEGSNQVLSGYPLYIVFIVFVGMFFLGGLVSGERSFEFKKRAWASALPYFLSFWLPLVASVLLMYFFVETGIMDKYYIYPATTKDPALLNPRWLAVILYLIGTAIFFLIGHWLFLRTNLHKKSSEWTDFRSLAFLVIGLVGIYVLIVNPFSLLFLVPVSFWFLIRDRRGLGKLLDIMFFVLGGLMLYALIYFFGWQILRYGWVFLWMFMNIISTKMFSFPAMLAGTAVLAAGLVMIINPQKQKENDLFH